MTKFTTKLIHASTHKAATRLTQTQCNKMGKSSLLAVSVLFASMWVNSSTFAADIKIEIEGVNSQPSKIYVQLFSGEANYLNGNALSATYIQAKAGNNIVTFSNVPAGEYAVRFFQDENNNGTLDTNLFGMPSEGYGFSSNAKPNYGPVAYQDAAFSITEDASTQINHTQIIY
ncbi:MULTISPECIES: DUF2141 domain-containing protein [Pseudomonadati]|uniref:DUF2141 domain-containing protein n=1 Tax=Shewanella aestuarii TaxID=1028752 RepID=A0ABT0KW52_9GAMM|nr:DUF2141 domain-containing protein [Shewanella aestuarii]MCL1115635.1 DUF2141 domain-containing protein [Shewanella aestuarii]GGN68023.1 hypothetical protein GCM10009193_00590 [Shewanella aestuarii]